MKHIILIDSLEKLVQKKDSSLLLALTMKKMNKEVYLLFEDFFFYTNKGEISFELFDFEGELEDDGFYIRDFRLKDRENLRVEKGDMIHMRLDPPFNEKYLRTLWMLDALRDKGVSVVNDPRGIMLHNEKIQAYKHEKSLPSFIGSSSASLKIYLKSIEKEWGSELIFKPLDLYQGIGIEKANIQDAQTVFDRKCLELGGQVIVQPFLKSVEQGEIRATYFDGREIGSIIKIPPKDQFLANIAQGATFHKHDLTNEEKKMCDEITLDLLEHGVRLVSFDILSGFVSEVNVTCPGLLVEVSFANKKNLAHEIISML